MSKITRTIRHIARGILGSFMIFAGAGHLSFARREFQAQVPDWMPMAKDDVVVYSGYVEIALGLLVLAAGHRNKKIPWALALFFLAVFPGNWAQYANKRSAFGLDTDEKRVMRLYFQPVLMLWALWSMGAFTPTAKKHDHKPPTMIS